MRQYPLEVDPPDHTESRKVVEPFFARPKLPEVIAKVEAMAGRLVADAVRQDSVEMVRDFAVVLQSKALTYLLNVPEEEADVWIAWGTHVYRDCDPAGEGRARAAVRGVSARAVRESAGPARRGPLQRAEPRRLSKAAR